MSVLEKVKSLVSATMFICRNIFYSLRLDKFEVVDLGGFTMGPLNRKYFKEVIELYADLHDGKSLDRTKSLLLKLAGTKFCYIVKSSDCRIIGMGLYYFNKRDIVQRTIHQGYTGLKEEYRGMGIGTRARKKALEHFAKSEFLTGVSSRVDIDNLPSLKGNVKLGFEIKEKYWDQDLKKERVYLVCELRRYRE